MPRISPRVLLSVTARPAVGVVVGHLDNLSHAGWDVHLLVGEPADHRLLPRRHLHVVPMARGRSLSDDVRSYRAIKQVIGSVRPDIVVGATPKAAALTLRAAKALHVGHRLWWVWGYRYEEAGSWLGRYAELTAGRCATHVVAASPSLAAAVARSGVQARVLGAGGIAGVDLDTFSPATEPETPRVPTAVFIGRLSTAKGLDHLAHIWPQVQAQVPGAQLLLAGEPDPLDRADLALARLLRTPGVLRLGYVADVPALLRRADVLVLPSRREGLPGVVLEAAASQVPAVVWDVTGSRDAVVNGESGRVVSYGDEHRYAEAVVELLADPIVRRRMGAAARRRMVELFDRRRVESDFEALLAEVLPPEAVPATIGGSPADLQGLSLTT